MLSEFETVVESVEYFAELDSGSPYIYNNILIIKVAFITNFPLAWRYLSRNRLAVIILSEVEGFEFLTLRSG